MFRVVFCHATLFRRRPQAMSMLRCMHATLIFICEHVSNYDDNYDFTHTSFSRDSWNRHLNAKTVIAQDKNQIGNRQVPTVSCLALVSLQQCCPKNGIQNEGLNTIFNNIISNYQVKKMSRYRLKPFKIHTVQQSIRCVFLL